MHTVVCTYPPPEYSCNVEVTDTDTEDDIAPVIDDLDQVDTDWALPLRYTREQNRRPEYVDLRLPAKSLPEVMAKTSTTFPSKCYDIFGTNWC